MSFGKASQKRIAKDGFANVIGDPTVTVKTSGSTYTNNKYQGYKMFFVNVSKDGVALEPCTRKIGQTGVFDSFLAQDPNYKQNVPFSKFVTPNGNPIVTKAECDNLAAALTKQIQKKVPGFKGNLVVDKHFTFNTDYINGDLKAFIYDANGTLLSDDAKAGHDAEESAGGGAAGAVADIGATVRKDMNVRQFILSLNLICYIDKSNLAAGGFVNAVVRKIYLTDLLAADAPAFKFGSVSAAATDFKLFCDSDGSDDDEPPVTPKGKGKSRAATGAPAAKRTRTA